MRPITRLNPQNSISAPTASATSCSGARSSALSAMRGSLLLAPFEQEPCDLCEQLAGRALRQERKRGQGGVPLLLGDPAAGVHRPGAREARREAARPGPQALQRSRRKAAPGRRALCLLDAARLLEERGPLLAQGRQALQRERERKAGLALGDVGEHGLAERVLVGLEVEQIVRDLERGAGVAAE